MKWLLLLLLCSTAHAKTAIQMFSSDSMAAGAQDTDDESAVVPNGKVVVIKRFGCIAIDAEGDGKDAIIALQWGTTGSYQTLIACTRMFDFQNLNVNVTGDGSKKFRLYRKNNSANARTIGYWFDAFVKD